MLMGTDLVTLLGVAACPDPMTPLHPLRSTLVGSTDLILLKKSYFKNQRKIFRSQTLYNA